MLPDLDHMSSPHFIHDPPIPNNAVLADLEDFINYFVSPPAILSVASLARRGGGGGQISEAKVGQKCCRTTACEMRSAEGYPWQAAF